MKISNNALSFLLAQYRAIFKRAYVKGLASAVILTAGLAAGAAQADIGGDSGAWTTLDGSSNRAYDIISNDATKNAWADNEDVYFGVQEDAASGVYRSAIHNLTITNGSLSSVNNLKDYSSWVGALNVQGTLTLDNSSLLINGN